MSLQPLSAAEEMEVAEILDVPLDRGVQLVQVPPATVRTTDDFIRHMQALPAHEQLVAAIPHVRRLHRIVHQILPQPNKGLWEPNLGLDPFILALLTLLGENIDAKQHRLGSADAGSERDEDRGARPSI